MIDVNTCEGSIPGIVRNDDGVYKGDLVHYFQTAFNERRNLCNPYYGFFHGCRILWLCYRACLFYRSFSPEVMRSLLIAALFHDFGHTGRCYPDSENIKRAIAGVNTYLYLGDGGIVRDIEEFIKVTEYPYIAEVDESNIPALILRDASMISQVASDNWIHIQQMVLELSEELKRQPLEVLETRVLVYRNFQLKTEWARSEFPDDVIRRKIAEAQEFVDILVSTPAMAV